MTKKIAISFGLLLLLTPGLAAGESGDYHKAMTAHDGGDFIMALDSAKRALAQTPEDPLWNHLAGKACIRLERYDEAKSHLLRAWKKEKDLPGLIWDIAFLKYKMSDFRSAAILFEDILENEPNNIRARYYMGVCSARTGQTEKAAEMFGYVRDQASDKNARENAGIWLERLGPPPDAKKPKKWRLHLKAGYRYDDNVRFEPLDLDIHEEDGDYCAVGGVYGKYDLLSADGFAGGIGYGHYQTWHTDLEEYDVTAMMGNIYSTYRTEAVSVGLKYLPAHFAMDSKSHLTRHRICPEILWHVTPRLITGISYGYADNDYESAQDRDGNTHEALLSLRWGFDEKGIFSATTGYEKTSAAAADKAFDRLKADMEIRFDLSRSLSLGLKGEYAKKTHDEADVASGKIRRDDRYAFRVSAERNLFYEWLGVMAEYDYTRNRSEIDLYDYSRQQGTVSVTVDY